ncbi:MAG: PIN domain-containing protein [Chloroflexi bacterium]|nr:PIN domain-containing protein [Chloroflexota bacterium]
MDLEFLDTNVIIAAVTDHEPDQRDRARALLRRMEEGQTLVTTCEGVLVEAVQVLSSKRSYGWARDAITEYLGELLDLSGLHLANKRVYLRALELYASTKIDFVDALNVAHMEKADIGRILSFDRDFDNLPGIDRREP